MDEKILFDQGGVLVTTSRFVSGGTTYAIRNVTSVRGFRQMPPATAGFLALVIGVLWAFINPFAGVPIAAIGLFVLARRKATFHVMLTTNSGESSAFASSNADDIERIVNALNQAIVSQR